MSNNAGKAAIMNDRKLREFKVVPFSFNHAVYLAIQENPGSNQGELQEILTSNREEVTSVNLNVALRDLSQSNYIKAMILKGTSMPKVKKYFTWYTTEKEYKPIMRTRKVAPNDKKAMKSIEKMTTSKHVLEQNIFKAAPEENMTLKVAPVAAKVAPVKAKLELVQGMTSIDANDVNFGAAAREIIEKITPMETLKNEVPKEIVGPSIPITTMWFTVGKQDLTVTPQQAYQLYRELDQIFNHKE